MTSTDNFLRDGYIAQLTTTENQHLFKRSLGKVPHLIDSLIDCESEDDIWNRVCADKEKEDTVNHQLLLIPIGLLSSIFTDDSKGPIDMNMLFTLCIIILNIIRETDDLKSSAYISRALISFLILPHTSRKRTTHLSPTPDIF